MAEMKWCTNCRQHRPLAAFSKHRGRPDGLQLWCKACVTKRQRKSDAARISMHTKYIQDNRVKRGCEHVVDGVVCGKREGLQHDHVRGTKVANVSSLASRSRRAIDVEIAKCEVVCYEHHLVRTSQRLREGGAPVIEEDRAVDDEQGVLFL